MNETNVKKINSTLQEQFITTTSMDVRSVPLMGYSLTDE